MKKLNIPSWLKWFMLGIGLIFFVTFTMTILKFESEEESRIPKIGFIILGDVHESGWNESHYHGIKEAAEDFGVTLLVRDNVKEDRDECTAAIRSLASEGAGMIFLCSYGYAHLVEDVATEYPNIAFATHSTEVYRSNLTSYLARMYQGRYLAGALAGMRSKSGTIGYVAAMPNTQVNRQINAFALGALRVNPSAKVIVAWTGEWENRDKESLLTKRLVSERGADILTYHQDDQAVPDTADAIGVDFIGFNAKLSGYSKHHIGTLTCRWDIYYRNILKRYLRSELNYTKNYWIGINSGAIWLTDVSDDIGFETGYALVDIRRELESQRNLIFSGPLYDRNGNLRTMEGEVLSDDALIKNMDWFVKGVEFLDE